MVNDIENLDKVIEAILFVSGNGVEQRDIIEKLEITPKEYEKAVKKIEKKYADNSGIKLIHYKHKIQFASNSDYVDDISAVLNPIRERELSKSTLEVIAIVAYKQPITRLEIENIRGVNSDYALQTLLKHNLIEVVGRKDTIGKPLLFGTTEEFLKRFEIQNVSDLPNYDDLIKEIQIIENTDNSIYFEHDVSDEKIESVDNLEEVLTKELPENDETSANNVEAENIEKQNDDDLFSYEIKNDD